MKRLISVIAFLVAVVATIMITDRVYAGPMFYESEKKTEETGVLSADRAQKLKELDLKLQSTVSEIEQDLDAHKDNLKKIKRELELVQSGSKD